MLKHRRKHFRSASSSSHWSANGTILDTYNTYLTAYWNMNETSGNRADSIGSNTLVDNNTVGYRTGKNSNSADFNGTTQYLSIADNADISPAAGLAVSFWIYMDVDANFPAIDKASAFTLSYLQFISQFYFHVYQSDDTLITVIGDIADSGWRHVVAIADSTEGKIYLFVDNVSQGTPPSYDGTIKDNASALLLGVDGSSTYLDGSIDEVAFWKNIVIANATARNAFVNALYNSGSGSYYS